MASPQEHALESDIPPKEKNDPRWLHDTGYRGGLHDFVIPTGSRRAIPISSIPNKKMHDDVSEHSRDEQQEEWEALRRDKAPSTSKNPKAKTSQGENTTAGLSGARKEEAVKQAMLWHLRMGHLSYRMVLALPKSARGVPSFEGLEVGDLPLCESCARAGDPFSEH
jgi:hypothetical protein